MRERTSPPAGALPVLALVSMPYWPLYLPLHCPLFHYFRRIPLRLPRRGARNLPFYLRTVIIDVLTEFNKRHKWPISFSLPAYLAGSGAFLPPNNAGVIFLRVKYRVSKTSVPVLPHPRVRRRSQSGSFRVSFARMLPRRVRKKPRESERESISFGNENAPSRCKLVPRSESSAPRRKQISRGLVSPTVAMRVSIYPMCIRECTP